MFRKPGARLDRVIERLFEQIADMVDLFFRGHDQPRDARNIRARGQLQPLEIRFCNAAHETCGGHVGIQRTAGSLQIGLAAEHGLHRLCPGVAVRLIPLPQRVDGIDREALSTDHAPESILQVGHEARHRIVRALAARRRLAPWA